MGMMSLKKSKPAMKRGMREKLVREGNPRLVNEQRCCRKQVVDITENDLIEDGWLVSCEASRKDPAVREKRSLALVTLVFQVTRMP